MLGAGSAEHDLAEEFSLQQTDDLLVFANNNDDDDDENEGVVGGEEGNGIDGRWLSGPCDLKGFGFSGNDSNDGGGEYLNLSCDDIAHLEWLSNFMEDSFSANMGIANHLTSSSSSNKNYSIKDSQFTSSSPDSVLESSISSSGKSLPLGPNTIVPGRARSKRPRPASFSPRPLPLISPTSSETSDPALLLSPDSPLPSESEDFTESKLPKKSSKKKLQQHVDQAASQHVVFRKCMHCGIQKTPQWRAGPMGPKTLCNACGVRYKSGRLFPEYRPAASPTFIPSLHSNSHKKVLEMRVVKSGEKKPAPEPEFVRKTNHLLECI